MKKAGSFEFIRILVAILISLLLGFLLTLLLSKDPIHAYKYFLFGPLSKTRRIIEFINNSVPLIFTGLAVSIVFKAEQFNIGAEGQLFVGAVAGTAVAIWFPHIQVLHLILVFVIAMIAGMLWASVPGILKSKLNASELVSSLMMNYVAFYMGLYFVNYYLRDKNAGFLVSYKFPKTAWLPYLYRRYHLHYGIIIALVFVVIVWYLLYRTKIGYEIRMIGYNLKFSEAGGIDVPKTIFSAQVLSGAVAGIAGAVEVSGLYHRFLWQNLPGYGFDGIIVALLARNNPLGVPFAALFLGYLRTGARIMERQSDMSAEMVTVLQALVILLVTAQAFLATWKQKMIEKATREEEAKENA